MLHILQKRTDIQLVVAQNDRMAIGAWEAANEVLPDNDILFIGVDALSGEGNGLEAILSGKLDASVEYATEGDLLIKRAVQILHNEPFVRDTVIPTALIDIQAAEPLVHLYKSERNEVNTINMLHQHNKYLTDLSRLTQLIVLLIFIVLVLVVGFFIYIYVLYRQKKRLSEELSAAQQRLQEATASKLTFFTNVSHDFRTPLTLIIDPVRQLAYDNTLTEEQRGLATVAERNSQIMLRLINQVLDFRKFESGKLKLHPAWICLSCAMKEWTNAFIPLAHKRHISLTFNEPNEPLYASVDMEKMERMMFNLIANAFKFTPDNGKIAVSLLKDTENFVVTVSDTGSGIPNEHKRHIFETFYQIDTTNRQGSGIGLALVKSFVVLHKGSVTVSDNPKGGTVFTISIPIGSNDNNETPTDMNYVRITSEQILTELADKSLQNENEVTISGESGRKILLAIDDNADIRFYLRKLFENEYIVLTAKDGTTGLQKARQTVPDIIICDLSMPDIDGLDVCRRIKTDTITSHIPVLMLTARSLDEQQITGFQTGADGYVSKPFNAEILKAQVDALLQNRQRVTDSIKQQRSTNNADLLTTEEQFVEHFRRLVLERLDDETLSVEQLAEKLAMSRTQLYRKIKALTNFSPNELIRNIRLTIARQMLERGTMTVSEVAYKTGFTSPSYFTKCYSDFFGTRPSETVK